MDRRSDVRKMKKNDVAGVDSVVCGCCVVDGRLDDDARPPPIPHHFTNTNHNNIRINHTYLTCQRNRKLD